MTYSPPLTTVLYPGSGNYIVANAGVKICRYEGDTLYFWDGKLGHEVSIRLADLQLLMLQSPQATAGEMGPDGRRKSTARQYG